MNVIENILNGIDVTYDQKCVPLLLLPRISGGVMI
jgi:hypothetical protein